MKKLVLLNSFFVDIESGYPYQKIIGLYEKYDDDIKDKILKYTSEEYIINNKIDKVFILKSNNDKEILSDTIKRIKQLWEYSDYKDITIFSIPFKDIWYYSDIIIIPENKLDEYTWFCYGGQ